MNVVAIGAHFDDIELGCGGTIARHVAAGDNVTMVVVTSGEYHWYDGDMIRSKEEALKEGKNAAEILGVKDLMYRSNWYSSMENFDGRFYIDISKYIDTKITSIKAHEGEYKLRGEKWIDFVKHQNRNAGIQIETEYAELFEVIRYSI